LPTQEPVFFDSTGRRARLVRIAAGVVAAFGLFLLGGFIFTLARAPRISQPVPVAGRPVSFLTRPHVAAEERKLFNQIAKDEGAKRRPAPLVKADQIAGAYFAPWEDEAVDAFRSHAADLTHVYPAWLTLSPDGGSVKTDDWNPANNPGTAVLISSAKAHGVRIVPVLSNASEGEFDSNRITALLSSPAALNRVTQTLLQFINTNGAAGLQIDFELLTPAQVQKLAPWLGQLGQILHKGGKELSIALEADLTDAEIRQLIPAVDYAVVMAYDEHSETDEPGAIASAGFVDRTLKRFSALIPSNKLVLGMGGFGYDWKTGGKAAESITNADALALAQGYRPDEKPDDVIDFDDEALEATFDYQDDDGVKHEVWFHDAASIANDLSLARTYHTRGAALWAIGQEDPSSWAAFGLHGSTDPDLHKVTAAQPVEFTGDGELLRVVSAPRAGSRTYARSPQTGLINDETYTAYASGWLIRRRGAPDKTVALTFDDGPDPTWTPKVLEILKRRKVPGTFFMIGQNVAARPDLAQRVYKDGNEIGNHSFTHPNMAHVSEDRVRLELTAAERALESAIDRQVTLFRPPYNADSEPNTFGEIMPVAVAGQLGYVTAGESIDPLDWSLQRPSPGGGTHRLTSDEIVHSVLQQLNLGHAILLHDAGGNRAATVAALDPLITALQARGYKFVTVGELEGRSRDQTMPALSADQQRGVALDRVTFTIARVFQEILFWAFSIAIILGLLRISMMIGLAAGVRARAVPSADPALPRVDALVAAYNEATVIARTIDSLLSSAGVDVHVIVVDDGSSDGTAEVVRAAFGGNPRVELLTKPNGGKASALNMALTVATAPVVVGVDADTQLNSEALALLAAWFADPAIGAVAGNVRVGNAHNLVTHWQSIEYTTSQNIDRRALARLNAITVVPGAIGAWRREALQGVGGYRSDTLAEDMDLTWRVRRAGWKIAAEPAAIAYTEAPDTMAGLLKQRFRWTYGTLQCLWKHRAAVFHYGWFGGFALPTLWLFQIAGQILAPFIDLQLLLAALSRLAQWIESLQHSDVELAPDPILWLIVAIYVVFLVLELAAGWVAYGLDRARKRELWLLPTQRLIYRQIMYVVVWRALTRALGGLSQAWGKLRRTGTVRLSGR
jgi:cellulose synthase/poly-beta-1,6-N-acetylglucosamine synthase-like glycosyltransferase/spore germination protein YaaH/peptidoglycan/xylan/chitin deacetylase (PgdA/CDA1 family)